MLSLPPDGWSMPEEINNKITSEGNSTLALWLIEYEFSERTLVDAGLLKEIPAFLSTSLTTYKVTKKGQRYLKEYSPMKLNKNIAVKGCAEAKLTELLTKLTKLESLDSCTPADQWTTFEGDGPSCPIYGHTSTSLSCYWCGSLLDSKPKLLIANTILCYWCAKQAYYKLKQGADFKNTVESKLYEENLNKIKQWQKAYQVHQLKKPFIVKLNEFFGFSDIKEWHNIFLNQNPEPTLPELIHYKPRLRLANSDNLARKVNRKWVLARDKYTCQVCSPDFTGLFERSPESLEVHHVLPRASGGDDDSCNQITLCISCHNEEKWFGHRRAFVTYNTEYKKKLWEWGLKPALLECSVQTLVKDESLFDTYSPSNPIA